MNDRDFVGEWKAEPEKPSPAPWSVRRCKAISVSRHDQYAWAVLDADGKCVAECDRQIDALAIASSCPNETNTEMLELLRELEWDGRWCKGGGDSDPACPYCDGTQIDEGHKPACKLAALLARFPR